MSTSTDDRPNQLKYIVTATVRMQTNVASLPKGVGRNDRRPIDRCTIATVTTLSVDRSLFRNPPLAPEREGREEEAELRDAGIDIVRIPPHPVHYYLDGLPTKKVVRSLLARQRFDAAPAPEAGANTDEVLSHVLDVDEARLSEHEVLSHVLDVDEARLSELRASGVI